MRRGEPLGAMVLCGGASRRMGQHKATLPFGDESMLARIVRTLAEVCSPLVVVAAHDQPLPQLGEVRLLRDEAPDMGPLPGIARGLSALSAEVPYAFVCATDLPLLRVELIAALVALRGDHQLVVPELDGHVHPLAALYACSLHVVASELVGAGERRSRALIARARTRRVSRAELLTYPPLKAADPQLLSVHNVNTPQDYRAALSHAGLPASSTGK